MKNLLLVVTLAFSVILGGCSIGNIGSSGEDFYTVLDEYNSEMASMYNCVIEDKDVSSAEKHYKKAKELSTKLNPSGSTEHEIMEHVETLNSTGELFIEKSDIALNAYDYKLLPLVEQIAMEVDYEISAIDELAGFEF